MRYELSSIVDSDPLDLSLVKSYLKVPTNDDDTLIQLLINKSIAFVESYVGRELRTKVWLAYFDSFTETLYLRKNIVEEVNEIQYVYGGYSLTLDPSTYTLSRNHLYACVDLAPNMSWPDTDTTPDSVMVRFTTRATDKIDQVRVAMMQHIAHMYENRGDDSANNYLDGLNFYKTVKLPNFPF